MILIFLFIYYTVLYSLTLCPLCSLRLNHSDIVDGNDINAIAIEDYCVSTNA